MLKAGDFIRCKKSEMVQISMELNTMGIMNEFAFEPQEGIQIMGPWLDPEVEPPAKDGIFHFALVNGRAKDGATCEEAPAVVEYWKDEGWFCDSMEVFDVVCWMPVPGFAKEENETQKAEQEAEHLRVPAGRIGGRERVRDEEMAEEAE